MVSVLYAALLGDNEIKVFHRDAAGALSLRGKVACPGGPMWLCVNPCGATTLFASTLHSSELVSYRVDGATGHLEEIGRIKYPDPGPTDPHGDPWTGPPCPCHVSTDATGKFVLTAFYTAGMVTVHRVDAATGAAVAEGATVHKTSHGCHSVQTDPANNTDCFVPCVAAWAGEGADPNNTILSGNRIFHFTLDAASGALKPGADPVIPPPTGPVQEPRFGKPFDPASPTNRFGTRPELGPRHVAFHPTLRVMLTSNEQGNSVTAYAINDGGVLEAVGTASTVPDDYREKSHTSEIRMYSASYAHPMRSLMSTLGGAAIHAALAGEQVHPSGRWAFCTNRGHDTVATMALDAASGKPSAGPRAPTAHTPQALELDPAGAVLYAAGGSKAGAGVLTTFAVDAATGALEELSEVEVGGSPIRLLAVDLAAAAK